jgi:tRNA(adenine34) deaminase
MVAVPHEEFMQVAIAEALRGAAAGEVPVGAVVVMGGEIVAAAHNEPIGQSDPTAHAEVLALREAGRKTGNYRLPGAALYVTVEPCVMCCGAALAARVAEVIFGAPDPKAGAAVSLFRVLDDSRLSHAVRVTGGVRGAECAALLHEFFRERRS